MITKLTASDYKTCNDPNISIRDLPSYHTRMRLDSVFQRGDVWTESQRCALIKKILAGAAIYPVVFNKFDNGEWHCVDGRQRIKTLFMFINNEFSVSYEDNKNNYCKSINYKKLMNSKVGSFEDQLKEQFLAYKLPIILYSLNDLVKVEELFHDYNNGTPLSQWEDVYCRNYLTRALIRYIYKNYATDLNIILRKQLLNDQRFKFCSNLHKCLIATFGLEFNSYEFDITKEINQKIILQSCRLISKKIRQYHSDNTENIQSLCEDDIVNKDVVKYLGIEDSLKHFKRLITCFSWIIDEKNTWSSNIDLLDFMHFISFINEKIRHKETSFPIIGDNKKNFVELFDAYVLWKNSNPIIDGAELNRRSGERRKVIRNKLEELWKDLWKPSKPASTKHILKSDKKVALAKSSGFDPITGVRLTKRNMSFDHADPVSKSKKSKIGIIPKDLNRAKSNLTDANIDGIKKYKESA